MFHETLYGYIVIPYFKSKGKYRLTEKPSHV